MKPKIKPARSLLFTLALFALCSCQTVEGVKRDIQDIQLPTASSLSAASSASNKQLVYTGDCPQIEAVGELRAMSQFINPNRPTDSGLVSRLDITDLQSICSADVNNVTVDINILMNGTIGEAGRGAKASYTYPFFVAVTTNKGEILAKEVFTAALTYAPGQMTQSYTEKMRPVIPLKNGENANKYKILIGFQLAPDQLAYNRQKMAEQEMIEEATRRAAELAAEQAAIAPPPPSAPPASPIISPIVLSPDATPAPTAAPSDKIYIGRPLDITP